MRIGLRSTPFLSKRYSEKVSWKFLFSPHPSRAGRISHSTKISNSIHIPLFRYFERQLQLASNTKLPLFLHCRNSGKDLIEILSRNYENLPKQNCFCQVGTETNKSNGKVTIKWPSIQTNRKYFTGPLYRNSLKVDKEVNMDSHNVGAFSRWKYLCITLIWE